MRVDIAGIVLSLRAPGDAPVFDLPTIYHRFSSDAPAGVVVDIELGDPRSVELREESKRFDSRSAWALYDHDGEQALLLGAASPDEDPYGVAVIEPSGGRVRVVLRPEPDPTGALPDPLQFPLGELLIILLLARGRGVMVHACGVDDGGRGILFAGNSTHGKSTMAGLWRDRATVLNDDRIALTWRDGRPWICGTPWHGDSGDACARWAPLQRVFFLAHSAGHAIRPTSPGHSATRLLARSFPPLWDASGMGFTLDFVTRVATAVPCADLDFAPVRSIVEHVRCTS
jgi:hypothetical protein